MSSSHQDPGPSTSPFLSDLEEQFEAIEARAMELVEGLSDEQLTRAPGKGGWSVVACLDHLNVTGYELLPRVDEVLAKVRPGEVKGGKPFRLGFFNRMMLRWMEPPSRSRAKSPKLYLPREGSSPRDVIREFVELQGELIKRLWDADGIDLSKVRVPSPVSRLIRFNLGMWFAFTAAHERRHLWQIERLLAAGGASGGLEPFRALLRDVDHDLARPSMAAVLPQEDALPGTQSEAPLEDRNGEGRGGQGGLDVRGHVVRPFFGVGVESVAFGNQPIEPVLEVGGGFRSRVLLDGQAGRGMTDEQCCKTFLDTGSRDRLGDFAGDFEQALSGRLDGEAFDHAGILRRLGAGLRGTVKVLSAAILILVTTGCQPAVQWVGIRLLYEEAPSSEGGVEQDLVYRPGSEDPKHRLDLFRPGGEGWPTLVFVHGGGWTAGDKGLLVAGADVYGNVGRFYAERGFGVAVINYRLQPSATWRDQVDDVAAALGWLAREIEGRGGDPRALFLAGHSAGAQLAARAAVDPALLSIHGVPAESICGVVPVSGAGFDIADERTYELGAEKPYYEERFRAGDPGDSWRRRGLDGAAPRCRVAAVSLALLAAGMEVPRAPESPPR